MALIVSDVVWHLLWPHRRIVKEVSSIRIYVTGALQEGSRRLPCDATPAGLRALPGRFRSSTKA